MVEPSTPFALRSDNHLYATTRNSLANNGSKIGQQLENAWASINHFQRITFAVSSGESLRNRVCRVDSADITCRVRMVVSGGTILRIRRFTSNALVVSLCGAIPARSLTLRSFDGSSCSGDRPYPMPNRVIPPRSRSGPPICASHLECFVVSQS